MLPIRALRLTRHDATTLDRMAFEEGELVFDSTNGLIRLMDGNNFGGKKLANQVWATSAISTAITANNVTVNAAIALKAPINNPGFTGTVTGITASMVGLGNVTNESKATMFSGPTFTGTVSGITATMVGLGNVTNESKATMFSGPTFSGTVTGTFSGNVTGNVTGNVIGNTTGTHTGAVVGNVTGNTTGNTTGTHTGSVVGNVTGDVTADTVISTSVTASAATITTAVTVGTNVNISTLPTQPQHATNKKYVDARSVAMSIAMS